MSSSHFQGRACSRRAVIGAVCLSVFVAVPGCLGQLFGFDMTKRTRNVVVKNSSASMRSITITIDDSDENRLFHYRGRVEPESVATAGTFHGPAHTITMGIDGSERTAEYVPPTGDCETETIAVEILDDGAPQMRTHCDSPNETSTTS